MSQIDRSTAGGSPSKVGFHLDKYNGKLMGVCSGIGNYFGIDPLVARIGFVIGAFASFGTAALIYIAIGLIAD